MATVAKLAEESAYADFILQASPIVELIVIMLELTILGFLIVLSVNHGTSFVRRVRNIARYHIQKAKAHRKNSKKTA